MRYCKYHLSTGQLGHDSRYRSFDKELTEVELLKDIQYHM